MQAVLEAGRRCGAAQAVPAGETLPGLCAPAGSCKIIHPHMCACMQAVLEAAHEMEIGMGYMEPPRLYQPVKHCLGYVLQQAGNYQRAAEVGGPIFCKSLSPVAFCPWLTRLRGRWHASKCSAPGLIPLSDMRVLLLAQALPKSVTKVCKRRC